MDKTIYDTLIAWENSILKKMVRVTRQGDETMVQFLKRRNRI